MNVTPRLLLEVSNSSFLQKVCRTAQPLRRGGPYSVRLPYRHLINAGL